MPPPVRYARSGDLNIAYQAIGQGPPDLIWCIGNYSHLDLLWEDPVFARTFERLGESGREVEQFLTGVPRGVPTQRFLTTLVAADIVGSTELIARIGDGRWRDLLTRHYELVSRRLTMHAGVEVDRAGDGFLARFDAPARAIRFVRDIDREDQTLGLRARAAVHTGEVEVSSGALRGIAVHIVSRLTSLASPGEVLVSSTVRDLVGGSGFSFVDRGVHALKGVPEPRQVFALA